MCCRKLLGSKSGLLHRWFVPSAHCTALTWPIHPTAAPQTICCQHDHSCPAGTPDSNSKQQNISQNRNSNYRNSENAPSNCDHTRHKKYTATPCRYHRMLMLCGYLRLNTVGKPFLRDQWNSRSLRFPGVTSNLTGLVLSSTGSFKAVVHYATRTLEKALLMSNENKFPWQNITCKNPSQPSPWKRTFGNKWCWFLQAGCLLITWRSVKALKEIWIHNNSSSYHLSILHNAGFLSYQTYLLFNQMFNQSAWKYTCM